MSTKTWNELIFKEHREKLTEAGKEFARAVLFLEQNLHLHPKVRRLLSVLDDVDAEYGLHIKIHEALEEFRGGT